MKKLLVVYAILIIGGISTIAYAATRTCEILEIEVNETEENVITLKCEDTSKLIVGEKVKLKTVKVKKAIEGC